MIAIEFENGQGIGNQLWCYAVARAIAMDRGYEFAVLHPEKFKGASFMKLDFGKAGNNVRPSHTYNEKALIHPLNGADLREYDSGLAHVADDTFLTGNMQDERYIEHRKEDIRRWFAVALEADKRDFSDENICVLNFRGSGYTYHPELFLPLHYWTNAMENMRRINPNFKFVVVTEDVVTARKFFPDLEIRHFTVGEDYSIIKNARYLILSNASFAWFPAWLSQDLKYCIAPKYWARHNVSDGYWCLGGNLTKGWMYQDRSGNLSDSDSCLRELEAYKKANSEVFAGSQGEPSLTGILKDCWRKWKAIGKDTSYLGAIGRMNLISLTEAALRLKSRFVKKSDVAAPKEGYQWAPGGGAGDSTSASKKIGAKLRDFIMIHGYY